MGEYLIKNTNVAIVNSLLIPEEKALAAKIDLEKNTIIFLYKDKVTEQRTRTSIQVASDKHIEPGDFGTFANHSCDPNSQIIANYDEVTKEAEVLMITIKPIKKGEEITFDYATTESNVTPELQNKSCLCGSSICRKEIKGFNDLSVTTQQELLLSGLTAGYLHI